MEKLPVNPNCELSGTKYCQMLNMHTCATCTIRDNDHKSEIQSDLDLYETLLPVGGISRLFQSRECQFCKGPEKGKRKGYAILDMAHPEPRRVQKWLFGKRTARIGTMIPLQMSVCKKCRSRFIAAEYLPMVIPIALGIAALFVFSADAVKGPLVDISMLAPFGGWIIVVLLGALLGRLVAGGLKKRWSKDMVMDAMQHPVIVEMIQKGWTPITAKSHANLLFSKSRMARGLGTAEDPDYQE